MVLTSKKYSIKIPETVTLLYCENKKILTLIGPSSFIKSLKLKVKILFSKKKKTIFITSLPLTRISNKEKKNLKSIKGTTKSTIKLFIIETSNLLYRKLKLIGVGYRAFNPENLKYNFITFKLGYSHRIYFKVSKNFNIFCLKFTKLFVFGKSFKEITEIISKIRHFKKPEPYKGKGILYESEKIKLKEGKKI